MFVNSRNTSMGVDWDNRDKVSEGYSYFADYDLIVTCDNPYSKIISISLKN